MRITDAAGKNFGAKVNERNQISTTAQTLNTADSANHLGNSYNVNTGDVLISGAADSAVLYFKNNEDENVFIDAVAVGLGTGDGGEIAKITVVRNPTAGDIVTDASAVAMNQNRNYGSSKSLTADAFKGKSGGTMTGGNDIIQFYQTRNGRLFGTVGMELQKGNSIGIKINPELISAGINVYAALIMYKEDELLE